MSAYLLLFSWLVFMSFSGLYNSGRKIRLLIYSLSVLVLILFAGLRGHNVGLIMKAMKTYLRIQMIFFKCHCWSQLLNYGYGFGNLSLAFNCSYWQQLFWQSL